ncbi:hypothetical protein QJQ45_027255 [Haematococcus lacustris]|nr:hypothetical protein QJQ45_027255 [Haematococcus lacustris]
MKLQSTSLRAGQKGAVGPHLRSVPRSSLAAASHRQVHHEPAGEAPALGQISRREALNATALLLTGLAVSVASPAQAFLGIGEDNSAAIQTSYDSRTAGILSLVQSTLDVPKDDPSKEDKVKELRKEINGWVADFRREPKVAGRPSYGQTYSVLNALAGHYNSFGATAPIPKKRMERITKVTQPPGTDVMSLLMQLCSSLADANTLHGSLHQVVCGFAFAACGARSQAAATGLHSTVPATSRQVAALHRSKELYWTSFHKVLLYIVGVRQDWVMKALDVLQRVGVVLGLNKQLYWEPVDPKVLPSYYTVITRPIFIGQIQDRLNRGIYQAPSEFAADMRLHWANVKQFNPKHDPFHILGLKAEACFEEAWAQSGYGVERARRASAAMPTQKFETDRSDGQAKNKSSRTPTGRPSRGAARADAPISVERRNQMATFLSDLPDELSDHFASLLPKELLDGMTSGELELDFENLDEATLKRIDQWLREIRPDLVVENGPASPTMVSNRSGVKVESYSDDDYVESDDDDDDE